MEEYGIEEKCREALFQWRWLNGYVCPKCGLTSHCALKSRAVFQCNHCHHQQSLTSGTIFSSTKLPLTICFLAIYLITQARTGTYHAINHKHLLRYLAEFCYRFNRRFDLRQMMPCFGYVATRNSPMPLRRLVLAEDYG